MESATTQSEPEKLL